MSSYSQNEFIIYLFINVELKQQSANYRFHDHLE